MATPSKLRRARFCGGRWKRLAKRGMVCNVASELEFFLFNNTYPAAFQANYTGLTPSSDYRIDYHTVQPTRDEPLMRALRNQLDAAEVPVETTKGEWGKGQHEINVQYAEPLPMADRHVVCKQAVKQIAELNGKSVTFMPKFNANEAGSSCHIHASVWQQNRNLFWDAKKHTGSKFFRQFLGGLLKYTPELAYFLAPTINAYKRFQPLSWAPTKMAWALDNRTVGFRVVGHENSYRIENRMPGADANPYLAFAATIAAGLAGVAENLDCGPLYEGNAYTDPKLPALPKSLAEAAALLDQNGRAPGIWRHRHQFLRPHRPPRMPGLQRRRHRLGTQPLFRTHFWVRPKPNCRAGSIRCLPPIKLSPPTGWKQSDASARNRYTTLPMAVSRRARHNLLTALSHRFT